MRTYVYKLNSCFIIEMDIKDIDVTKIVLKNPHRYDDYFISKIEYELSTNKKKFIIKIPNTNLLSYNDDTNVFILKSSKQINKLVVKIEDYLLETSLDHCTEWFGDKIKASKFEDSTQLNSCAILHSKVGEALKLKSFGSKSDSESCILEKEVLYNVSIQLYGIRFSKNNFVLLWKVIEKEELKEDINCMLQDDEDEEIFSMDLEQDAKDELMKSIELKLSETINIINELELKKNKLNSLKLELENVFTFSEFVKISESFDFIE